MLTMGASKILGIFRLYFTEILRDQLLRLDPGKVFKSFMAAYLPDWEEREQTLREFASFSYDYLSQ